MTAVRGLSLFFVFLLAACAPQLKPPGSPITEAKLTDQAIVMRDGAVLPLHVWWPPGTPKAIILALHGFNDYGAFIKKAASFFSKNGVQVYAYDQRGFGRSSHFGFWPGHQVFAQDATVAIDLLRRKHLGLPVYLLGMSMGGAVVITAMTNENRPDVDGVVLVAPAVWGRESMPFYQRWALWLAVRTVPWMKLSAKGLKIRASDNDEMLRELRRNPLFIKETRVDTIWGLVNLMDLALKRSAEFRANTLLLYGDNDEIIPKKPTELMFSRLPQDAASQRRLIRYENGYHMLLRDLQAETVWRDILKWVARPH